VLVGCRFAQSGDRDQLRWALRREAGGLRLGQLRCRPVVRVAAGLCGWRARTRGSLGTNHRSAIAVGGAGEHGLDAGTEAGYDVGVVVRSPQRIREEAVSVSDSDHSVVPAAGDYVDEGDPLVVKVEVRASLAALAFEKALVCVQDVDGAAGAVQSPDSPSVEPKFGYPDSLGL
jgi:hypothetical protein